MASPGPADLARLAPDEQWAQALHDAPRHLFAPETAMAFPPMEWLDRNEDPDAWWAAVYRDTSLITQVEDGATALTHDSATRKVWAWSSSLSEPRAVLGFLELLDPYPGDRVLEIGTGTGWTAALLSARVGASNVTTIEVDEQLAKIAAANLDEAGVVPHLVVGDGARGCPEAAPFDRVHVTCGVATIPYAWVEQTRLGGVVAFPWMHGAREGFRVRLVGTGDTAVGRIHGGASYMMLRAQRAPLLPIEGERRDSTSRIDPRRISRANSGLSAALAGLLPGVSISGGATNRTDGTFRVSLRENTSDSHAIAIQPADGGMAHVSQTGPRLLWDELETAYLTWVHWGQPGSDRFGLTVDQHGQSVWLDSPDNRITEGSR
ncbi:protein-L-isoaspartate(D-aspartate) O-methyltransferase [Lipingzhangella halophila]|uniref:Protein-L-isoaspartate O-methyltransferase n=1 Tax=Lipingzhangella halophila TaxID=1783352 RepID=A0A7W7W263_9ACTN|nr:methyltransferase domain-containing protein [Lipingzhangella halophila]MBB4931078.1 protein-L-isoaspartate(D-aspartate) O-methyltransferase [Lipingzhangella halophila]